MKTIYALALACILLLQFGALAQTNRIIYSPGALRGTPTSIAGQAAQPVSTNAGPVVTMIRLQNQVPTAARRALAPLRGGQVGPLSSQECITVPGLAGWWGGDNSAADTLGLNSGTWQGEPAYCASGVGNAFDFYGSTAVEIPYSPILTSPHYSIEAWINPYGQVSDPIGQDLIFGQGYGRQLLVRAGSEGLSVAFAFSTDPWTWYEVGSNDEIPINEPTHLVGTFDGSTLCLYLNGRLNSSAPVEAVAWDSGCAFHIGGLYDPQGDCAYVGQFFNGWVDEVSYYGLALSADDVAALYAGQGFKCWDQPPCILRQPESQRVPVGGSATLDVWAVGMAPLSYQWRLGETDMPGETASTLNLDALSSTGSYSVQVGYAEMSQTTTSEDAVVTVYVPTCVAPSESLVGWWAAEGNPLDSLCANDGAPVGGPDFASGVVGQAFSLNGTSQYVQVPSSSGLTPTAAITVEAWIYPRLPLNPVAAPIVKKAGGDGGYSLELLGTDRIRFCLYLAGQGWTFSDSTPLQPNRWSHVAGVYNGSSITFYLDGQPVGTPTEVSGLIVPSSQNLQIGHDPSCPERFFTGLIDEASVYSTALSAAAVQAIYEAGVAGKCQATPTIVTQPASQTVAPDWPVTFSVVAYGAPPLSYQWFRNGGALPGATGASLTLSSVSLFDAGAYKVVVSSRGGCQGSSAISAAATLNVSQVAAPVFSPSGGSYPSAENVVVTCSTPGAVIRYTTDGQEPQVTSQIIASGSSLPVNQNLTLKANAWKAGWTTSTTETEGYRIEATPSHQPPTVTISPPTGIALLASDDLPILVEASPAGQGSITRVQLFRDGLQVAENTQSPLQYTLSRAFAGTYTFVAKAMDNAGFVTVSPPTVITVNASGPVVSLAGQQPFFTSSPGTLVASVLGVDPGGLASLTLNGAAQVAETGTFTLSPALAQGVNYFTLAATDDQSRAGQASATVYLDSVAPTIVIAAPANNSSFPITRINVSGTFTEASLKRITVNGIPAFVTGSSWEALNVPLAEGANIITATAQDLAGNTGSASITVTGSAGPADPVQLTVTPVGGFAPLQVTFTVQAATPGTLQEVLYDFTGDGATFQTAADLQPVTHTYSTAGQYFPVVTLVTTAGRFSSRGGWNSGDPSRLRLNVQTPPQQIGDAIDVMDPVDLKATANGSLYILSRSTATILEYSVAVTPPTLVRSVSGIGTTPTGLDVDSAGSVYVAISGDNQVAKFIATATSFQLDPTFGTAGIIGKADKSSGNGDGEFNSPYDVGVSPGGAEIAVSDYGNNRIQRFAPDGTCLGYFGQSGSGANQFNGPKGLAYGTKGYLYMVDSGNSRVSLALGPDVVGTSGSAGIALGQFQGAVNLSMGDHGLYVADTGNNRVQAFDPVPSGCEQPQTPFSPRGSLSSQLALNQPSSVAVVPDLLGEKIYIADTGNNRVILVKLPGDDPLTVWNDMVAHATPGDLDGALSSFSRLTVEGYRQAFLTIGISDTISDITQIGTLAPVFIKKDTAEYYFERTIEGHLLLFTVNFIRENGVWKIMEF